MARIVATADADVTGPAPIPLASRAGPPHNAAMRHGPLKLKAQILCGEAIALGPGKADLLEAIAREGSISAAGRALGISYRRTWLMVDEMNRCWAEKLVATGRGGGGGARLTDCGEEVLAAFRALETAIDRAVARTAAFAKLNRSLRDTPLPAAGKET